MRQEKLSGLIHSSNAYPNLEYCNVEIHFHEIKDLVSTLVHDCVLLCLSLDLMTMKSCLTPIWSYRVLQRMRIRANTISMAKPPIILKLQPY